MKKSVLFLSASLIFGCLNSTVLTSCSNGEKELLPVSDIVITQKYENVSIGTKDFKLYAVAYPDNSLQDVIWESENEDVAKISEDGIVSILSIGSTKISAISKENPAKSDSFILNVNGAILKGKITSTDGSSLKAVIEFNGVEYQTDNNGNYSIPITGKEETNEIHVRSEGYVDTSFLIDDLESNEGIINGNITLLKIGEKITIGIKGKIENNLLGFVSGASVKVDDNNVTSLSDGSFNLEAEIGENSVLEISKEGLHTLEIDISIQKYLSQIIDANYEFTLDLGDIEIYTQSETYEAYNKNGHVTNLNIYRGKNDFYFELNSNFEPKGNNFYYKVLFDFGNSEPADKTNYDSRDFELSFDSEGIKSSLFHGDGTFIDKNNIEFSYIRKSSIEHIITINIPYDSINANSDELFGIDVVTKESGNDDRTMKNPSGYTIETYNDCTYARVDLEGNIYQGNTNNPVLGSQIEVSSEPLGIVGDTKEYQYKLSVGKNNEGLIFTFDKVDKSKEYIIDGTFYHIFIDTVQSSGEFNRITDNKIYHFAIEAGKWVIKYTCNGTYQVFDNPIEYENLVNSGVKLESNKGLTYLFIPYSYISLSKDSIIGLAANCEIRRPNQGTTWEQWNDYPETYKTNPHVELVESFVRLDSNLNVISNTWSK